MPDMLQDAAEWLADQQATNLSREITYRRGGTDSDPIAAVRCPLKNGPDTQFGILRINERDWIIKASLLLLDGTAVEPQKNDQIIDTDGSIWQVLPTEVEHESRLLAGEAYRIHTKRVTE
jgi:hypothetical protein